MSFSFNKSLYRHMGPDGAEDEIGGSVLSDLQEGDHFTTMEDVYDFTYYLSKATFSGDYDGPVSVVAIFRGGKPDQRIFTLDYKKHCAEIDDESLVGYPEDWKEVV